MLLPLCHCLQKSFFLQAASFSNWLNKLKKCAAHAAFLSLIFAQFFVQLFVV